MDLPNVEFFPAFWAHLANFLALRAGKLICPAFPIRPFPGDNARLLKPQYNTPKHSKRFFLEPSINTVRNGATSRINLGNAG